MHFILTETKCILCQTKLTYFEIKEKEGLCISCYKEKHSVIPHHPFVIPKKKTKK